MSLQHVQPIEMIESTETTSAKFKNAALIICLGVFVALLMSGELGHWLNYLTEHNFALNAGALIKEPCSYTH